MKKLATTITIIAIAAILMFRSGILTENSSKENFANKPTLSGNRTIHKDLILNDGLISPGYSPGKITVTGDFTLGNDATYKCELKDLTGAGTGHDQIDVSGNTTIAGTLDIILDGYSPDDADMFDILKYGGSLSGTFSAISGLPAGWQIDYGVKAPGKISLYGPNSPLPVELLNFKVTKECEEVLLSWQTASEQNSDHFTVEHSTDGKKFTQLGQVKSMGTGNAMQNYSWTDKNPATGINYYRLKQVDNDGQFTYSKIISVIYEPNAISFYPNPAKKSISFNRKVKEVTIYDMQGKEVINLKNVTSGIDISTLKTGVYVVDVNQGEYKGKLIVE